MSRHTLTPRDATHEVVVGWDGPMQTFFAQVFRTVAGEEDDDTPLLWLGCAQGEVREPEDLATPLAPWAALPAEVIALLRADRAASAAPTPLQRLLLGVERA